MQNLFNLDTLLVQTNDAAAEMVAAFQAINKNNPTEASTKKFYSKVVAFDIALEARGKASFTAYDASTREAILELHAAMVLNAYKVANNS